MRAPKWKHDRITMLPSALTAKMHEQIVHSRLVHEEDLASGWGRDLVTGREGSGRRTTLEGIGDRGAQTLTTA